MQEQIEEENSHWEHDEASWFASERKTRTWRTSTFQI